MTSHLQSLLINYCVNLIILWHFRQPNSFQGHGRFVLFLVISDQFFPFIKYTISAYQRGFLALIALALLDHPYLHPLAWRENRGGSLRA